jgi:hypothetical protein
MSSKKYSFTVFEKTLKKVKKNVFCNVFFYFLLLFFRAKNAFQMIENVDLAPLYSLPPSMGHFLEISALKTRRFKLANEERERDWVSGLNFKSVRKLWSLPTAVSEFCARVSSSCHPISRFMR